MNHWIDMKTRGNESQRRIAADSLKRCPLCGAVNALTNGECFVCRWAGEFDRDPIHVEQGLTELLDRCPELADAMSEPPSIFARVRSWFRRLRYRMSRQRLDIFA